MIAIDFGTTNSSAALIVEGDTEPRVQRLSALDADAIDPSIVPSAVSECRNYECRSKPVLIGYEAIRHYFNTDHDISFLQEMKLHFDQTTKEAPSLVNAGEVLTLREEGGFLTPERRGLHQPIYEGDVPLAPAEFVPGTANLIKGLLVQAGASGEKDLVFGVPASFQTSGKKRLREAAKRAIRGEAGNNYEGISIYFEPVAAARAYRSLESGNTLVLDYGGGTLDISVMRFEKNGSFNPDNVKYGGFSEGGSRMDQRLLEYCLDKAGIEVGEWFPKQTLLTRRRVKRNVEEAKIRLSVETTATVEFPGTACDRIEINRADLTTAFAHILNRMIAKVSEVVIKAVGSFDKIDFVVLSGGSSLSSVVQDAVHSVFRHIPKERFFLPNPKEPQDIETCLCAVAKGLAWLRYDGFPPIDINVSVRAIQAWCCLAEFLSRRRV
jgi:molecular chaperone DnaK (HSP70)